MSAWRPLRRPRPAPTAGDASPERGLESTRRSSSLPSGVFKARSPTVEKALAGGVADVFLRHMARLDGERDVHHGVRQGVAANPDRDQVGPEDIAAFLTALRLAWVDPPPRLDERLATERIWILLDLAVAGDSKTKQAASRELMELANRPCPFEGHTRQDLRELCGELDRLEADESLSSVLLRILRLAAHAATARVEDAR